MDRNLKAFLAVARAGNLTAAADTIGLTQPALTKTIRRLEQEYRAQLFVRSARGMRLTPVGETLFARAETIEMHHRQAHEEIEAMAAGSVSSFRIGAGAAYQMTIAPLLVKQLIREYPETRFVLDFDVNSITLPKLVGGEIDLMLGAFHTAPPEGIDVRQILTVEITAYCCRSNPLAQADKLSPASFASRDWVMYRRDHLIAERIESYFAGFQLPSPRVVLEVDSLISSFSIVSRTPYFTLAPTSLRDAATAAGLVMLDLEYPVWKFASGAWFRRSWRRIPIMQRALELLASIARDTVEAPFLSVIENRN